MTVRLINWGLGINGENSRKGEFIVDFGDISLEKRIVEDGFDAGDIVDADGSVLERFNGDLREWLSLEQFRAIPAARLVVNGALRRLRIGHSATSLLYDLWDYRKRSYRDCARLEIANSAGEILNDIRPCIEAGLIASVGTLTELGAESVLCDEVVRSEVIRSLVLRQEGFAILSDIDYLLPYGLREIANVLSSIDECTLGRAQDGRLAAHLEDADSRSISVLTTDRVPAEFENYHDCPHKLLDSADGKRRIARLASACLGYTVKVSSIGWFGGSVLERLRHWRCTPNGELWALTKKGKVALELKAKDDR